MAKQIKTGIIGVLIGVVLTFGGIAGSTGSYKQKVDDNKTDIVAHETRLDSHDSKLTAQGRDIEHGNEMIREVRADVKILIQLQRP